MSFLRQPWVQVLLIVAALAGVVWLFWPPPLPRPDESQRRSHPAGYSIIIPPGYDFSLDVRGNASKFDALAAQDNRYQSFAPRLSVERFRKAPDPAELTQKQRYKPATFLGKPAYVFDGPRGPLWHHRIIFESGGQWFEIAVMSPDYVDVPKDRWYDYVKSFRYEPSRASPPPREQPPPATTTATTAPAGAPATGPAQP